MSRDDRNNGIGYSWGRLKVHLSKWGFGLARGRPCLERACTGWEEARVQKVTYPWESAFIHYFPCISRLPLHKYAFLYSRQKYNENRGRLTANIIILVTSIFHEVTRGRLRKFGKRKNWRQTSDASLYVACCCSQGRLRAFSHIGDQQDRIMLPFTRIHRLIR